MTTYTVGEIAKIIHVSSYTLRYYDKEGLLPFSKRDAAGRRIFDDKDLELFGVINCLKRTGMPVKEIGNFVKLYMAGDETLSERKIIFEKQKEVARKQLEEIQGIYDYLNYVCWFLGKAQEAGTVDIKYSLQEKDVPEELRAIKARYDAMHISKLE
ncbi:MerR family transcriptional regulator [Phascolarctobacterium faecium]|uniref:MerR family transcriptional regulator n=1 Tax=Phascolarctobacterium faecium TaxID=33025 RepID=UPI003AB23F2F